MIFFDLMGVLFRSKKRDAEEQDLAYFHWRVIAKQLLPRRSTEDVSTNVWQTAISTLITEGEPAVKTATDLFSFLFSITLLGKKNEPQNRPA